MEKARDIVLPVCWGRRVVSEGTAGNGKPNKTSRRGCRGRKRMKRRKRKKRKRREVREKDWRGRRKNEREDGMRRLSHLRERKEGSSRFSFVPKIGVREAVKAGGEGERREDGETEEEEGGWGGERGGLGCQVR